MSYQSDTPNSGVTVTIQMMIIICLQVIYKYFRDTTYSPAKKTVTQFNGVPMQCFERILIQMYVTYVKS